jgi:hypothetical protein
MGDHINMSDPSPYPAIVERVANEILEHWYHPPSRKCACGAYVEKDPRARANHLAEAVLAVALGVGE